MKSRFRDYIIPSLVVAFLFVTMLMYRPAEIPSLLFDEGWTLTVARNWVERGVYGRLLQGNPISAVNMAKPFSVTGPIALSFNLFGVGIWQGRLTAMIFMALALFLIFQFARKLSNPLIAYLSLFVLFFMAIPSAHPWIMGREAMGEAPMVFYLTAGYLFLLASLSGNKYAIFGSMVFFGLALDSKGHVLPFWSASLAIPMVVIWIRKQWKYLRIFIYTWLGSFPVFFLMSIIQKLLNNHLPFYDRPMEGFFFSGAFVLSLSIRLITLQNIIVFGIPTLIGIIYGVKLLRIEFRSHEDFQPAFYIMLSILTLVTGWFIWFTLLSMGWARYFFPISFFGSIFVALWLEDIIKRGKHYFGGGLKQKVFSRIGLYVSLLIVIYAVLLNISSLRYQFISGNNFPSQIAEYVKQNIGSNELIETYESPLIFLLNNPLHYPSDQVHVALNKRTFFGENVDITYDPSHLEFKYLIDGPMSKMWQLYTSFLAQGHFQLKYQAGDYQVYERLP